MNRPRIFISTVTRELKTTRQRIANILTSKGYEPEWQDVFGSEPGDLRDMLRRKLAACHGLIQIVGNAYGAEPQQPDPEFGRCSYTQFEFLYAKQQGKKTWLVVVGPDCQRDSPPDRLDLPRDAHGDPNPAHPDPAAYQAERRQLQRDYQQRPEFTTHLYYTAESDVALDLAIERMDDKLDVLRKGFRRWQAVVLTLIAIVLASIWWAKKESHNDIGRVQQGVKEIIAGQKFDAPRIRAHLVESTERQRDADLAAAKKATPSAARQRLREAATAAHQSRLARIDDTVARFAELDGRADTTTVSRELTRILTEEGVDAALAYAGAQKPGILAEARAQQAAERERLRTKLQPLLSAANLQRTSGQTVAARAAYRELLAFDSAWPSAVESAAWFLHDQTIQNKYHGTLADALSDAGEAHTLATRLHAADPTVPTAQRLLSATHNQMGDVLIRRSQDGDASKVEEHYTRSLSLDEALLQANPGSAQATRDVSLSLDGLGDFLAKRGQADDADKALGYFTRSLDVREALLHANPGSAQATERLGIALSKRNQLGDAGRATQYFDHCILITKELLGANRESGNATSDLADIYMEYGDHAERTGRGDAQSWWRLAHGILSNKEQKGMFLSPDDRRFLEELRTKLK